MSEDRTTLFRMPGGLMAELKCHRGTRQGETFSLSAGTFVIGRSSGCDLVLAEEPGVSKIHAKIVVEEDNYFLVDQASRNGTLVNGKPITKLQLNHGDTIQVCGCGLTFFSLGATGLNETDAVTDTQAKDPELLPTGHSGQTTDANLQNVKDESTKFYSDEKAHTSDIQEAAEWVVEDVDEEADTIQPIDTDNGLGLDKDSTDSMTVTAALVSAAEDDLETAAKDTDEAIAETTNKDDETKQTNKTEEFDDGKTVTFSGGVQQAPPIRVLQAVLCPVKQPPLQNLLFMVSC